MQYLKSKSLAEEIVQEVFFKFWEKSDSIAIRTTIKSYLYGAVRNTCLNHIKHLGVRHKFDQSFQPETSQLPTDIVEFDELKQQINEALNALPEKCRIVFEKSRFEEKSYKEIAEELDISVKTVENQMGKALKVMRDKLGHLMPLAIILMVLKNYFMNE